MICNSKFRKISLYQLKHRLLKLAILFFMAILTFACGSGGGTVNTDVISLSQLHWAKSYGGSSDDGSFFSVVQQTTDGGYIMAGDTTSFGAGSSDILVIKIDATGSITWQKTYGGGLFDGVSFMQQTNDGGYIVAGNTVSFGLASMNNIWVLKLNPVGSIIWQKAYGAAGFDVSSYIQQTNDDGYIVSGLTNSSGAGSNDYLLIKLDSLGSISWQKTYGGADSDQAASIQQTNDSGYIVSGLTNSFGVGNSDIWILKLNSNGSSMWQKTIGGVGSDWASYISQTRDNGYIVAGGTESFGSGNSDFWVLKLTPTGTIQWQKTYGNSGNESASYIQQTSDTGFIVTGSTGSFGAGKDDFWVLKLNTIGNIIWQKTYGGIENDNSYYIQQTSDGGYVVSGNTLSFGEGLSDLWILRLKSDGTISTTAQPGIGADTSAITLNLLAGGAFSTFVASSDSSVVETVTSISGADADASVQTQASD